MVRRFIFTGLMVGMSLMLLACQSNLFNQSEKKLTQITKAYEGTIRWGRIENAYQVLLPELLEQTQIPTGLGNIRVTHYEVVTGPTMVTANQMTQTVLIQYLYNDEQKIRKILDKQVWIQPEEKGDWFRANPIPDM